MKKCKVKEREFRVSIYARINALVFLVSATLYFAIVMVPSVFGGNL